MDWKTFIQIYNHPVWNDTLPGGLAYGYIPRDFNTKSLYQGALIEFEHTGDPFVAVEIAMDHLVEDPNYYQKLAKMEAARRNPALYEGWSLGRLKKEEQRLIETLDDYIYFKESQNKIDQIRKQLEELRQAILPSEVVEIAENLPEAAIHDRLAFLHNEAKTLSSLERLAFDEGNISADSAYRRTRMGIEDTMVAVKRSLSKIAAMRKGVKQAQQEHRSVLTRLADIEESLKKKPSAAAGSESHEENLKAYQEQQYARDNARAKLYEAERTMLQLEAQIKSELDIVYRDLRHIGYGIELKAPPPPHIELQVVESAPVPHQAPPEGTTLPQELRSAYEDLSTDPQIRDLQLKLKIAVADLTAAIEDNEPPYFRKKAEARVAQLHAEIERLTKKRRYY